MKVALLLADGFEEIEALTPLDMLRRAGIPVDTIGINTRMPIGSHGIKVEADILSSDANPEDYGFVIFPGGMPGATNLDGSEFTDKIIAAVNRKGGRFAAICAAPLILGRRGMLRGKTAICYPGFEKELIGAKVSESTVVTDGNITTAKGMGVALAFAKEIVKLILGDEEVKRLSQAIME